MPESRYLLDNVAPQAEQRFAGLEMGLDPTTFRSLERTGVGAGWTCLEVGAGGGSVARWLADRVGPSGHVLVTDVDPRWLATLDGPNVEVRQHDIVEDALPRGHFDLAHERLVLLHLTLRDHALDQMVRALKPGGWLVVEDFDSDLTTICPEVTDESDALVNRVWEAFLTLIASRGLDRRYGRGLPRLLRERGLIEIQAHAHIAIGASAAQVHRANVMQSHVHDGLLGDGLVSEEDVHRFLEAIEDPTRTLLLPPLVSAAGRLPG